MQFIITTEVDAPPVVVFAVLSEVERWPERTPTVTRVERLGDAGAPLALGGRLRIVQPKVPPAEWTVTALEPGRGFRIVSRSPGATVEGNHWAEPTGEVLAWLFRQRRGVRPDDNSVRQIHNDCLVFINLDTSNPSAAAFSISLL